MSVILPVELQFLISTVYVHMHGCKVSREGHTFSRQIRFLKVFLVLFVPMQRL